jgi:hypothetical protein
MNDPLPAVALQLRPLVCPLVCAGGRFGVAPREVPLPEPGRHRGLAPPS